MRRNLAFSFAEIMGVCAMIGLIAAIAVPQYFTARKQAEEQRVQRDLASIRDAVRRFYQETGYGPAALSDLISTTKPTTVYKTSHLTTASWGTAITTPTDMPWNGPYLPEKPTDPPGTSGGASCAHWGLWAYDPTTTLRVYADSTQVMTNGQTYAAYTIGH